MRIYLQAKKLHYQPVTYDPESHDAFSLEACLAAYTSLNTLSGSNQLKCETCGKAKEQRNKVWYDIQICGVNKFYRCLACT